MEQEVKEYIKNNLKMELQIGKNYNHYLALVLEGETIDKVKFDCD